MPAAAEGLRLVHRRVRRVQQTGRVALPGSAEDDPDACGDGEFPALQPDRPAQLAPQPRGDPAGGFPIADPIENDHEFSFVNSGQPADCAKM